MDSKSLAEQEKDIRDLLRRAERTPVKTSALRRDTLKRLIDLAHSPHPSLKIIAATHLKLFIRDFSDLEDDAINAVYDLCEDPAAGVRIKGYAAIVDVSREQNKWIKRNTDVLVQLLQSDEPEEVTFVKRALTQHLDMDPVVTLGVLCDQVVPPDEPVDEEELAIRDRIRSLVFAFLAGEARRPLIDRHANCLESPAESVLVSGLFKAITKLPPSDVNFIIKDIIVSLPSFTTYSPRGKELLDILLTQARVFFKSEIPGSFTSSCCYLDLASFVTVERRLAHPSHLLRFYYAVLVEGLLDLARLSDGERSNVIRNVACTLAACEDVGERAPPNAPVADLGRTSDIVSDEDSRRFSDVCVMLLQSFADSTLEGQRPWRACLTLVQAIARRKRDSHWQTPQAVLSALERIKTLCVQEASIETKAAQEQVHSLIRLLVQPVKPPVSSIAALVSAPQTLSKMSSSTEDREQVDTSAKATSGQGGHRSATNSNKRKLDTPNRPVSSSALSGLGRLRNSVGPGPIGQPSSLPPRPSPATVAASGHSAPTIPRADRQSQGLHHLKSCTPPVPFVPPSESSFDAPPSARAVGSAVRSTKKVRTDEHGTNSGDRGSINSRSDLVPVARSLNVLGAAAATKGKAPEVALLRAAEPPAAPSLLSRLAGQPGGGSGAVSPTPDRDQLQTEKDRRQGRRSKWESNGDQEKEGTKSPTTSIVPAKRPADISMLGIVTATPPVLSSVPRRDPSLTDFDKDPVIGFSIRGAAKAAHAASTNEGSRGAGSLLERLQSSEGVSSEWGGKRRKRTKHF